MRNAFSLIWLAPIGLFRSRASLQAEILTLRHQLNVLRTQRLNGFSHQLTEAYGWIVAPRYIIRDRDAVYGDVFIIAALQSDKSEPTLARLVLTRVNCLGIRATILLRIDWLS